MLFTPGFGLGGLLLASTLISIAGVATTYAIDDPDAGDTNLGQASTSGIFDILSVFFSSGSQGAYTPSYISEWGPVFKGSSGLVGGLFASYSALSCYNSL